MDTAITSLHGVLILIAVTKARKQRIFTRSAWEYLFVLKEIENLIPV